MSYSPQLEILRELRERVGLTQADMARLCGLQGQQSHQTAGAWERGEIIPNRARRKRFIGYLWDHLRLRENIAHFEQIWEILVDAWAWDPIADHEWAEFTRQARLPRPTEAEAQLSQGEETREGQTSLTPFQAPAMTPHFVGRATELTQLRAYIGSAQEQKVYALVGMGGVGKSSLAIQIAHNLRHNFVDGVLWASASTSTALDIIEQWAQEYDCDFSRLSDLHSRAAALRSLLAQKNALLILDDIAQVTQIQPLLPSSSKCVVLLTTRSEDVAVALGAEVYRLSELSLHEGVALLAELLGSARVESEVAAAEAICQQLQCLPLALEIVGQLLSVRSQRKLADLTSYLEDVNNRLSLQISDRAVRTSFMASWEVLDEAHQRTFACLGVFAGREFSAEAVAHVATLDLYSAQDHLYSLVALSLVRESGKDRFQQHPLLAGFAREQIGDASPSELRMAQYYEQFVRKQSSSNAALEEDWESITAGMQAAFRLQEWPLVLAYGRSLCEPWFRQARYGQAREGYRWMDAAATAINDIGAKAFAQQKWGFACLEQDDYQEAAEHLDQSMRLFELLQDQPSLADNFYWLARLSLEQGQYADAQQYLESCHQGYQDIGNAAGLARAYYQQASLAYHAGELAMTQQLSEEAYAIQVELDDKTDLLPTLRLLADVAIERKDYAAADRYCQEAYELAQALHDRAELAAIHYSMTVVARCTEELERALQYCEQASMLFEAMGDRAFFALTLYERSKIDGMRQKMATALTWGHRSLALFQELEDDFNQVYVLHHLGQLYSSAQQASLTGTQTQAYGYWQQAYFLAQRIAHPLAQDIQISLERYNASR